jgi:hypothetical protein
MPLVPDGEGRKPLLLGGNTRGMTCADGRCAGVTDASVAQATGAGGRRYPPASLAGIESPGGRSGGRNHADAERLRADYEASGRENDVLEDVLRFKGRPAWKQVAEEQNER